jgi:nitroimidazol reductase NimA-like FMN-containing flavoprotein (pyridoxamine 5'-phosphate oxidase superfamily)
MLFILKKRSFSRKEKKMADDLSAIAESVLRSNRFLTLGTTSKESQPWVAPLMYAVDKQDRFYWVSATDAVHSQHISENPNVAFVIFDSDPEYGKAQGLYCSGRAEELKDDDLEFGCNVFYSMRYPDPAEREKKGRHPVDFEAESPRRMYRATVTEYSVLHPAKHPKYGSLIDYRVVIPFHTSDVGVL